MIIIQGITVDDFFKRLEQIIHSAIKESLPKEQPEKPRLLTRKELAAFLKVSLPTIHSWTKLGIIQSYRVGRKIYYKSTEIEEGMIKRKFRRI